MRRTYRYPRYRRAAAPFELTYVCTGSAGAGCGRRDLRGMTAAAAAFWYRVSMIIGPF